MGNGITLLQSSSYQDRTGSETHPNDLQWTSFSFLAAILTEPRIIHYVADSFTNQEHSFQSLETVLDPSSIISDRSLRKLRPYHHCPCLNYL
ncbi:hypothetical protein TNCV_226981 [Trichonephila clavipes]|nr:hypothetical protein TNCV_226981 [Trichonephila clavipes]